MADDTAMVRSRHLLEGVRFRQRLAGFGRWAFRCLLVLAGLYALLLVTSRLLGLIPDWFTWQSLLLVPAAALLAAFLLHRRPATTDAARLVDSRMATKDLFLTVARIEAAAGDYKPLVIADAEARAADIRPQRVVALAPWPRAGQALLTMGVLAASLWLPPLDPFGTQAERKKAEQRRAQVQQVRQRTAERASALRRQDLRAERSEPTESALDDLRSALRKMQPDDRAGNIRKLGDQQKSLGDQWRRASERKLARSMQQGNTAQRLGATGTRKGAEWKQALSEGRSDGMKKQLGEIAEMARELKKTTDPARRRQLQDQMKNALREMADFAADQAGSPQLRNALAAAMQQLDMSAMDGASAEALDGLLESLELSQMELEALAQAARDMNALQQAMQALQQARALNDMQPLDGQQCQGCDAMGEYIALYSRLMAQCQGQCDAQGLPIIPDPNAPLTNRRGGGMGNPGQGRGNVAPEDPTQQTAFQTEKARTFLSEGRILMQWKTKAPSERGEAVKNYRDSARRLRDGVDEAILAEEIPPGYHDPVRKYFGTIAREAEEGP